MDEHLLITRYLDDQASEEEMRRLNELLKSDAEVRAEFLSITGQAFAIAQGLSEEKKVKFELPKRAFALAACVAFFLGLLVFLFQRDDGVMAELVQSQGEFEIPSEAKIFSGDTIKTFGSESTLDFQFDDGTTLHLAGDTIATITGGKQKKLLVHQGAVSLDVMPQPEDFPLMVRTPTAELMVRGTSFSVLAAGMQTQLEVIKGAVDFKRLADGQSLRVDAGHYSVIGDRKAEFLAKPIPEVSRKWVVDFRNANAKVLDQGHLQKDGVRSEAFPDGGEGIVLKNAWIEGDYAYFKLHQDSKLKMRIKMDTPSWLNFIVLYRSPKPGSTQTQTCLYQDEAWWEGLKPGEWRTIEIPLRKPKQVEVDLPMKDDVPLGWFSFSMSMTSGNELRGLVIERIWVE